MHGKFFLRIIIDEKVLAGDEPVLEKTEGMPGLPKPWDRLLLDKACEGKVIETLEDSGSDWTGNQMGLSKACNSRGRQKRRKALPILSC